MKTIYLGMGSNIGDKSENLKLGLQQLRKNEIEIIKISSLYETAPVGYLDQDNFYNIVLEARTEKTPEELLVCLKSIEKNMGRKKTVRFGPRNIDIDILLYEGVVLNSDILTIPHERMTERAFVMVPLSEIAPNVIHPIYLKPIQEIADGLDKSGITLMQKEAFK